MRLEHRIACIALPVPPFGGASACYRPLRVRPHPDFAGGVLHISFASHSEFSLAFFLFSVPPPAVEISS